MAVLTELPLAAAVLMMSLKASMKGTVRFSLFIVYFMIYLTSAVWSSTHWMSTLAPMAMMNQLHSGTIL